MDEAVPYIDIILAETAKNPQVDATINDEMMLP
jgi:hypothetical protein